ncbi:MAG: hypothetical protein CMJ74_06295 [Planctomycetaceae bacterium]|nr:hypothetical protein [Planctomycetaceae bacterium]|tara:strand:+ start:34942 stop:35136 length:195 start_codon:yes stop_codon:yes gene_type:complete
MSKIRSRKTTKTLGNGPEMKAETGSDWLILAISHENGVELTSNMPACQRLVLQRTMRLRESSID